jgi:heterodisulfide reductase subunit A2
MRHRRQVGNIILATGYDLFDAAASRSMATAGWPTSSPASNSSACATRPARPTAKCRLRDGVTKPKRVAILHCVGSRDRNYNNYCSVICCMSSLKFAHLVKERTGAEVFNFYIDMRTAFKDYDEFYQRVLSEGVRFIRGRVAEVTDAARMPGEEGSLIVQAEDTLVGRQRARAGRHGHPCLRAGAACRLARGGAEVRHQLQPRRLVHRAPSQAGSGGDHDRRHPHRRLRQGPKDIPASVSQGAAAAARVLTRIGAGEIELEPVRASVNAEQCSGCRICNDLCPFNAILFHEDTMVTEINPRSARAAAPVSPPVRPAPSPAPASATTQILSQIEGLLLLNLMAPRREVEAVAAD